MEKNPRGYVILAASVHLVTYGKFSERLESQS